MLIRKITLRNFRNFKNCEIEFSCDPEKNFTIILGQNTYGKTTLVKSFIWCLYRINLFDDKILLNSDVADSLRPGAIETAKVEVELEHKGFSYKITTKETYTRTASGSITVSSKAFSSLIKVESENAIPISNARVEEEIESILRPELKEYFFFDGETNSIESVSTKKNLTSAVTNILGLNHVEMIKDYYDPTKNESVTSYLRKELIVVDEEALDDLNEQLTRATKKKEKIEEDIKNTENEISRLEGQLKEQNDLLDANKDVEKDQNDKKRLESDNKRLKEDKEKSFQRMIQMFNTSCAFLKVLFAVSYIKYDLKGIMEESSFKDTNSYKGINEEAVDELIAKGRCICGAVIMNGNDAYKHLMEARQHMEPHDFGKYISDFVSAESSNVYGAQTTLENIIKEAGNVNDAIATIDENENRLKTIRERIAGRADVGEIQRTINNITYQKGVQEGLLKRLNEEDLPEAKKAIETIVDKIEKASVKNDANDFTQQCIDYAMSIYELADKKISKSKIEIRERLQEEVGKIFKSMYHGNREIKIDEYFKATTVVAKAGQDKKLDKSTGLGTVVNYSFVAGLMNLAKQSIVNDDDIGDPDSTNETYPLVMDAPFSNTDDEHIKNICKALPSFCDQIVMFVMQKDFNYASDSISHKVGKMYRLSKISETEAVVVEEKI